ncbi:MAG: T9SS type A sorting domain-containing protein [Flavobacteriales bacterium]|nr:T9SS type A sorting domain-containing protein [Flavobacteriales bacterium]
MRKRILLPFVASLPGLAASAQSRQSDCLWSEDFEQGIPVDWSTNQVERQTAAGVGIGEFVPAFTAGTASDANAGGFFPVPDMPAGNRFAMANDDAAPCNCDLDSAVLATPSIDLSGLFNIALDVRVHHTRALGGGEARIDFSADGGEWQLFEMIPSGEGWRHLTFNMSLLGGISDLRLRFQWSDSANWASGFALDDICIRERLTHDLSMVDTRVMNEGLSCFATDTLSLGYRLLPLEQSRPMALSVDLFNPGTARLYEVAVSVLVEQGGFMHGPFTSQLLDSISSGERVTVVVPTDWAPDALGPVSYQASAVSPTGEDDPSDNSAADTITITGPGWDDGYGAMALDAGEAQGVQRSDEGFIAMIRCELVNEGSTARAITARLDPASQVGEEIRGIIFDGSFELIDTTLRHVITPDDLANAGAGLPIHLPFPVPPALPAADCFAGLQRLPGAGTVGVLTSGNGPIGSAALMQGISFDITWLEAMPMVRLHLSDYGVAVPDIESDSHARIHPVPANDVVWIGYDSSESTRTGLTILDGAGRVAMEQTLTGSSVGDQRQPINVASLSPGVYVLRLTHGSGVESARLVIAR